MVGFALLISLLGNARISDLEAPRGFIKSFSIAKNSPFLESDIVVSQILAPVPVEANLDHLPLNDLSYGGTFSSKIWASASYITNHTKDLRSDFEVRL